MEVTIIISKRKLRRKKNPGEVRIQKNLRIRKKNQNQKLRKAERVSLRQYPAKERKLKIKIGNRRKKPVAIIKKKV